MCPICNNHNFNTVCPSCSSHNNGCNAGGHCNNWITNGLHCNDWDNWSNQCNEISRCGCQLLQPSNCVFYSGATTSCLGIRTNTTLTDVIQAFDAKFCTISPSGTPSGVTCTAVIGQTGQIITTSITPSGGQCSAYNISISPVILNQINTNATNISTLFGAISGFITNITTNTPLSLDITNPSVGVFNIDYIPPSSGISGILHSDYSSASTSNTSWTTIKTFPIPAFTLAVSGDKIIARTLFRGAGTPASGASVRVQFNSVTVCKVFQFNVTSLNGLYLTLSVIRNSNSVVYLQLKIEGATDNSTMLTTLEINGTTGTSYVTPMAGLNLGATPYSINCDIQSISPGDASCEYLEVELIKHV